MDFICEQGMRPTANKRSTRNRAAYTVIEMMVVAAIVLLVAVLSLPMMMPVFRTSAIRSASNTVKQACIRARSLAISHRDAAFVGIRNLEEPVREQKVFVFQPVDIREWEVLSATGDSVTVDGTPWTANEWVGMYALVVTGEYAGVFRRITANTPGTLSLEPAWREPAAFPARTLGRPDQGDEFRIVEAVTEADLPDTIQAYVPDDPTAASPTFTHGDHAFSFAPNGSLRPMGRLELGDDGECFWIQDARQGIGKIFHVFRTTGRIMSEDIAF